MSVRGRSGATAIDAFVAEGPAKNHWMRAAGNDERWAKWLQSALESYRVPRRLIGKQTAFGVLKKRLAPVFRDRSDMSAATDLGETITDALKASANLIVICSPSASASRGVNEEIAVFRRLGRSDRIFCLIVAGTPNGGKIPGRETEECFPNALRATADGTSSGQRLEPIAADARPGGDGKGNVKLKILSGLLNVGLDVLKQREQRRRIRHLTAVTATSLVIMLITTGLAIEARRARLAAYRGVRSAFVGARSNRPRYHPGSSGRRPSRALPAACMCAGRPAACCTAT